MKCSLFALSSALVVHCTSLRAQETKSFGLSGGFGSYARFAGEFYLIKPLRLFRKQGEVKAGVITRNYPLSYGGIKNLNAASVGVLADVAVFPFAGNGFFTGIRLEFPTFNWLNQSARDELSRQLGSEMPVFYPSGCAFAQIGYRFPVSERFAFRLYAQPGIRYYYLATGKVFDLDFMNNPSKEDPTIFIYNFNLAIEFKL